MAKKNNMSLAVLSIFLVVTNAVTAAAYFRANKLYRQCGVEKEELMMDSLAMRASESVKRLQVSAADASQAVQQQTEKTLAELQQIAKDAADVIRGQSEKMAAELQVAGKGLLDSLNKELETFQQNMNTPVPPDASAPSATSQPEAPHS
jgi:uncharacterized protein YlxW (UPF0749 family)